MMSLYGLRKYHNCKYKYVHACLPSQFLLVKKSFFFPSPLIFFISPFEAGLHLLEPDLRRDERVDLAGRHARQTGGPMGDDRHRDHGKVDDVLHQDILLFHGPGEEDSLFFPFH